MPPAEPRRGGAADTWNQKPKARVPKVKKPTVVKPPAGDIASSGGDYGMKEARKAERSAPVKRAQRAVYDQQPVKRRQQIQANASGSVKANLKPIHDARVKRDRERAKSEAGRDVKSDTDRARADRYKQTPAYLEALRVAAKGRQAPASTGPLRVDLSNREAARPAKAGVDRPRTDAEMRRFLATGERPDRKSVKELKAENAPVPVKILGNAAKDAAEIVATTPTSTYMLGKTAVTHPEKLPGMIAAPYKEFAKNPVKFATEHPVSTALMFAPGAKVPGRVAGKGARLAGKQTLRGETRTLPGTALKQETRRSKDAVVNAVQARKQGKRPTPTISEDEIRRRVDEHVEYRRKHTRRVEASKSKEVKQEKKALPKDQRAEFVAEELKGARGGAGTQNDRTFVREFGSTWQRDAKTGAIVKPKNATEGHIHTSRADAEKIAERLEKAGHGDFVVKQVSENEFGVVPKVAAEQLRHHQGVGTGKATYAKVLRVSRQKFTNAVLPTSPKWLTGQLVEGTLRANIRAGGPIGVATGLLRERKVYKALEKQREGAGKEFRGRALPGGHYGGQIQEFRATPLHEIFDSSDGKIGEWLAKAGRAGEKAPGAKRVVNGWNRYTRFVFDQVNGHLENAQQRAMLGRELKDSPLMERSILGLSDKAAREAAEGLRGTETQVQFGRAVERAYGKYSSFSPSQRERNLHWTPFVPWFANAVKFLTQVLPKDHPVLTGLLVAANASTQKEREKLGLSLYGKDHKPLFMMGGIPLKDGRVIRIGRYLPFGLGGSAPSEALSSLVLPQFAGTYKNLVGIDWKGDPLKHGVGFTAKDFTEPETLARALATQIEALTPGAGQLARITGVEDKISGKDSKTIFEGPHKGKRLRTALDKEFNPARPTGTASTAPKGSGVQVKIKPVKVKAIKVKPVKIR